MTAYDVRYLTKSVPDSHLSPGSPWDYLANARQERNEIFARADVVRAWMERRPGRVLVGAILRKKP